MSFKRNLLVLVFACAGALPPAAPVPTASAHSSGKTLEEWRGAAPSRTAGAQAAPKQATSSATIRWKGRPGVERYRLQVALDQGFDDIIFDRAVTGRQHVLSVPPGKYFWRVAPAVVETGSYSTPQPVEVVAAGSTAVAAGELVAQGPGGWKTATGQVPRTVAARLRARGGFDFVGVNTDGTVYAIDGTNGVALWVARYKPAARPGEKADPRGALFSPLPIEGAGGRPDVVVAFDGGLRALKGETGVEVWRAALAGRATAGIIGDINKDGKKEVVAVTKDPASLIVLDVETGRALSDSKLESVAVGAPAILAYGGQSMIVVGLEGGTVEAWRASGERVRSVKLESKVTTGPLVVPTLHRLIVVVGGEKGLLALNPAELKPLGMINTGEDSPRGTLTAADLDGDGTIEIVMVTRGGRVALIGTTDGKIKWVAEGAGDADSAALADLNGDGVLDVIAAAGPVFAHGFSGKDGALIWRVEEEMSMGGGQPSDPLPRSLTVAQSPTGEAFLVGGDPSRMGLRAVELPKGSAKAGLR